MMDYFKCIKDLYVVQGHKSFFKEFFSMESSPLLVAVHSWVSL